MKDIIVSGIQPSGEMHIGNYLGALKDFVELQDKPARPDDSGRSGGFECFFFIADLHSLTEDFDPKQKSAQILDLAETFLAAGLDPEKCTIFVQSHIPAHSELAWILNTVTPMSELERMTQYKDKALKQKTNVNAGLFDYPVLMAADILLYKPTHVPVGHDQIQHLEFTNTVARKFNNRYGEMFTEIKPYVQKPFRIMSLTDPTRKMSKSEPDSAINMFDEPDVIKAKLAKAVTATNAPKGEVPPGVQNLFDLMELFGSQKLLQKFKLEYDNSTIKYSELKTALADEIAEYFAPMRTAKTKIHQNQDQVIKILQAGAAKAQVTANQTLAEVKTKLGLL